MNWSNLVRHFFPEQNAVGRKITSASHGWGSLSQINMPSGVVVNYKYTWDGDPSETIDLGMAKQVPRETVTEKKITHDGITDTWTYQFAPSNTLITNPDGSTQSESYFFRDTGDGGYIAGPNGTGSILLYYDLATNGKGRFHYSVSYNPRQEGTAMPYYHADVITDYDALGRPANKWQGFALYNAQGTHTAWQQYNLSRTYNLAGGVTSETYPSGRTITNSYDTAGRLGSLIGTLGDGTSRNYATGLVYNPAGQLTKEAFSTTTATLWHRMNYNVRHQLFAVRVGTGSSTSYDGNPSGDYHSQPSSWDRGMLINHYSSAAYTVGWGATGGDNNGNILRSHHYVPVNDANTGHLVFYQDYLYDSLNRVTRETENTYGGFVFQQSFSYDRWGNRTIDTANTTSGVQGVTNDTFTVNTANNRLTAKNSIPFGYDSAGNQTTFSTFGLNDYEQRDYDAENRMSKAIKSGLTNYYFYDANGKRVRRIVNGTQSTTANETWMVYGFDGELVAEYAYNGASGSPQKEYGYRGGQLLIVADNSDGSLKVRWEIADHLGSPRMSIRGTGSDGGSLASVTRHDYLPFGEEVFAGARRNAQNQGQYGYEPPDDGVRQQFTGHERDDETGLDFMKARYYSSAQGRFISPDLPKMDIVTANPQSINRYTYVRNNPCGNVDPSGRCSAPAGLKKGQTGICVEAFISTALIPGIVSEGVGARGDNRGPTGIDSRKTSRVHVEIIITPKTGKGETGHNIAITAVKAGVSETLLTREQGTADSKITHQATDSKTGKTNFTLWGTGKNGFAANNYMFAPQGTIDFNLNFIVSKDGKVQLGEQSKTREYPTYEAYSYQVDDEGWIHAETIFVRPETDIGALERPMTDVPDESKNKNKPKK